MSHFLLRNFGLFWGNYASNYVLWSQGHHYPYWLLFETGWLCLEKWSIIDLSFLRWYVGLKFQWHRMEFINELCFTFVEFCKGWIFFGLYPIWFFCFHLKQSGFRCFMVCWIGVTPMIADLDRCCFGEYLVYVCNTNWLYKVSEFFSFRVAVSNSQNVIV